MSANQSVSLNPELCSVPNSHALEDKQFICDFICSAFSQDNSKVTPILSLRNMSWKLAPESLVPFPPAVWTSRPPVPPALPTKLLSVLDVSSASVSALQWVFLAQIWENGMFSFATLTRRNQARHVVRVPALPLPAFGPLASHISSLGPSVLFAK